MLRSLRQDRIILSSLNPVSSLSSKKLLDQQRVAPLNFLPSDPSGWIKESQTQILSPESIIVPIVSCILGFPLLALLVICCLRRRAKLARERARRRNCDMDHGALSLVRFSPVHRLAGVDRNRTISLRSERGSRAFPSLELDTVVEERSDPEQSTALELSSPD